MQYPYFAFVLTWLDNHHFHPFSLSDSPPLTAAALLLFQFAFTLILLHLSNVYVYTRTHIFNSIWYKKMQSTSQTESESVIMIISIASLSLSLTVPQHCKPFSIVLLLVIINPVLSASNPILLLFLLFTRWHDFIVNASPVIVIIIIILSSSKPYKYNILNIYTFLHVCKLYAMYFLHANKYLLLARSLLTL